MAERKARVPTEIPDMPASFEKEFMEADGVPSVELLNKYDAKDATDLKAKIVKAAQKVMSEKEPVKKAKGGTTRKKPAMARGGMVKANCGASMKPQQKNTPKGSWQP